MHPLTLHGIPNCDTVKRARAWLAAQGVDHAFHDFKKLGLPAGVLPTWRAAVGADRLLNRQGTSWRKLDPDQQAAAATPEGLDALLQAQPSLIKRPLVQWPDGALTVGFDPADWARRLGR